MKLNTIFTLPFLPFKTCFYWNKSINKTIPGKQFARYGFNLGLKLLLKGKLSLKLLFNPVSIVRYFEYDFADYCIGNINEKDILDVSSPHLFGFFITSTTKCKYHYVNPDSKDLQNVKSLVSKLKFKGDYFTDCVDATKLPYPGNSFDRIVSISVIEHVNNNGDSEVMREMWRALKPGGLLILTFPVKNDYEEEFVSRDIYNLNREETNGKFFFQRYYNDKKIEERLLSSINNFEIVEKKVFGEITNGFYNTYKKKWEKSGYWETVKDPYYISKHFKYFPGIKDLTGLGVMGLTIKKLA
ncbi:MAG: class I SAM-dependent methyltransferase [Ignavibacteriaceae bacterium]|nr:class I SAM-dependent methyltransferase [Ignavibacteriaceae bacterium]